jgi:hypothetical protein
MPVACKAGLYPKQPNKRLNFIKSPSIVIAAQAGIQKPQKHS